MDRGELLGQSARRAWLRERFSTPASAILAYAEMLVDDSRRRDVPGVGPELGRIVDGARRVVDHLGAIEDLLALGSDAPATAMARIRHDIRTPLTTIKGYAELLLEDAVDLERPDLERLLRATLDFLLRLDALAVTEVQPPTAQPLANPASLVAAADRLERLAPMTRPGRILVIEDDADIRELLHELLLRGGHETVAAATGPEGLLALAAGGIDLVLLDLIMPGMNGFEVLEAMRADPAIGEVPVIVVSGLDHSAGIGRCLQAGAQDVLRKPFDAAILNARVAMNLERKRLRDRERRSLDRLAAEKRTADALLANILPAAVVERLSRGERLVADRLEDVTVLFADIVDFTGIATRLSPVALVADLDRIVSGFDDLAASLGVEKIKTVGDAYLAAAGVPAPVSEPAAAAARLALGMVELLATLAPDLNAHYRLRVGVHTGPVLAGVIGKHKFTYDIWGDTVNLAARLQSVAVPGEIWISGTTRALLGAAFTTQPRGLAELRGRGQHEAFALMAMKSEPQAGPPG